MPAAVTPSRTSTDVTGKTSCATLPVWVRLESGRHIFRRWTACAVVLTCYHPCPNCPSLPPLPRPTQGTLSCVHPSHVPYVRLPNRFERCISVDRHSRPLTKNAPALRSIFTPHISLEARVSPPNPTPACTCTPIARGICPHSASPMLLPAAAGARRPAALSSHKSAPCPVPTAR